MTKLTVNLPSETVSQAEDQAAAGGYSSVDQYIRSLIENDVLVPLDDELQAEALRGLQSGSSNPLTPELLDQIARRARAD